MPINNLINTSNLHNPNILPKLEIGQLQTPTNCQSCLHHLHIYIHTHNHFTALCILSRPTWVSWYQNKHSPTHTYHGHQSSLICFLIYYDPWHPPCSIYVPDSLFPQSLSICKSFAPHCRQITMPVRVQTVGFLGYTHLKNPPPKKPTLLL